MTIAYPLKTGLYLNLTNACDANCVFCLRNNAPGVYGTSSLWLDHEPSMAEIRSAIDAWDLAKFEETVFCGYGEPTMRLEEMLETARYVKTRRPEILVRLNTNGLANLYYKRDITPLLEGLFDTVSISLNTSDPARYVEICRPAFGEASHAGMIEFAKLAKSHVPDVVFTIVDSPVTDRAEQERCRAIASSIGVRLRIRKYETTANSTPPEGR